MIRGGVIPAPVPLYDPRESFQAHMHWHGYLRCWWCGTMLMAGRINGGGAPIFACPECAEAVDVRRVG